MARVPVQYVALENEEAQLEKFAAKIATRLKAIHAEKAEIEAKMEAKKSAKKDAA